MNRYAALLRGVNLGNRRIKMAQLKEIFESLNFHTVTTVLASGNVLFDTESTGEALLRSSIEKKLEDNLGYSVSVILRPMPLLKQIVETHLFDQNDLKRGSLAYITFFNKPIHFLGSLPYESEDHTFQIMKASERELYTLRYPLKDGTTTRVMTWIDKTFGKDNTTRNWNTIQKLLY